jgi:hypothetical protein
MKRFSTVEPSKNLERPAAWACLLSNVLVLPGLGTITAGLRTTGILQIFMSLVGMGITLGWFAWFFMEYYRTRELQEALQVRLWLGFAGVGLFMLSWTWALATSLQIIMQVYSSEKKDVPPKISSDKK